MSYAIIKLGGKQYVVREGEKLLVDRLSVDENKTFKPEVIFEGGDGKAELSPKGPYRKVLSTSRRQDPDRQVPRRDRLPAPHGFRAP